MPRLMLSLLSFLLLLALSLEQRGKPPIIFTKPKRAGFVQSPEARCLDKCEAASFLSHTVPFLDSTTRLYQPWITEDHFNKTLVHEFCDFMTVYKECVDKCPDGHVQRAFAKSFRPVNYMCNESDYIRLTSCYVKIFDEYNNCHNDDKCGQKLNKLKSYFETADTAPFNTVDPENVTFYLIDQCEYYNCYFPCIHQPILDKCSNLTMMNAENGFEILKTLFQYRIKALKDVKPALTTEGYDEPMECYKFRLEED